MPLRHFLYQQAHGGSVSSGTALQAGRSRIPFPMVSSEFFWPWGRLFPMRQRRKCVKPYHLSTAWKSGSPKLKEPSRPAQELFYLYHIVHNTIFPRLNIKVRLTSVRTHLIVFNPLKTKRRLLYLKTQFVPRSKHFSSRL